jgi:hypothetical protein
MAVFYPNKMFAISQLVFSLVFVIYTQLNHKKTIPDEKPISIILFFCASLFVTNFLKSIHMQTADCVKF